MIDADLLEKTRATIQDRGFETLGQKVASAIYLFFSFDLVNSTQFKIANPSTWPLVIMRFYELAISQLNTRFATPQVWKFVGDEVLFFSRISSKHDLFKALNAAYASAKSTTDILHSQFPKTKDLLAVKSTVWIAKAESLQPGEIEDFTRDFARGDEFAKNIVIDGAFTSRVAGVDFLGPEIDVGFRISKYALRQRLVVSADLAWLLYRFRVDHSEIENQLRIVSFELMKGVWGARHYPVIWFESDWKNIDKTFLYDEHLTSEIAKKVNGLPAQSNINGIEKIFADLGRDEIMGNLAGEIENLKPATDAERPRREISFAASAEVHCVAVCISPDGRVLAARRPESKRRFAKKFEFGCGQLRWGDSFEDCLRRAYADDFGARLKFPEPLIPISTFQLDDPEEKRQIPGIIFFAEVENPLEIETKFSREKHSEIIWIEPHKLPLSNNDCVPNFATALLEACEQWKRWRAALGK
jgi:hypothetical protein